MDKVPNGGNVVVELFGEGKCLADQAGNALPQGVVEPLDVAGLATLFTHGFVTLARQDQSIGFPEIGVNEGTLPVNSGQ